MVVHVGVHQMRTVEDRLARLTLAALPTAIVLLGCGASLLPHRIVVEALDFLIVWLTVSLSVGVLVGHCTLSESDCL